MIPLIGLMVGLYIITRCLSFILREGERKESVMVQIVAGITIIASIYVVYSLFTAGLELPVL